MNTFTVYDLEKYLHELTKEIPEVSNMSADGLVITDSEGNEILMIVPYKQHITD